MGMYTVSPGGYSDECFSEYDSANISWDPDFHASG